MTEYRLKAVYFPGEGTRLGYRKAMVYEDEVDYFLGLGAAEFPPDLVGEEVEVVAEELEGEPERETFEGDKGSGRPGSFVWQRAHLKTFTKRKEVLEFMQELVGKDSFPVIVGERTKATRKRALRVLEEMHND